jgi:preprotein translocase SecF subunit
MFRLVERRRYYFLLSAIIVGLGFAAMIVSTVRIGTPFPIGVDFQSGTRYEVQFTQPVTEGELRNLFVRSGSSNPSVTSLQGEGLQNAWQIRTEFVQPETSRAILEAMENELAPFVPDSTLVQTVSPAVGAEVTRAAFVAIIVAAVIVLLYIMFSFRQVPHPFRYGAAAVTAMLHDIAVTFGFISVAGLVFGWEVDALFLTAVLTVAGFSLQDTIVVFDRIRENIRRRPLEDFELLANRSILETIHRSLATQLNAMFVMVAILLFGGASIKHFIAVLLVGLFSGTYSSIFNAVPLLVAWEKRAMETT